MLSIEQTTAVMNMTSRVIAENQPTENHAIKLIIGLILASFTIAVGCFLNRNKK